MAGAGALLMYDDQHRITITVVVHILDLLHIAGGCPLVPQLLTAAAPEPGSPGFQRLLQ